MKIATAPVDGAANSELCRYLAQVLGLRKSEVYLDKVSCTTTSKCLCKYSSEISNCDIYHPPTKLRELMFSVVSVCNFIHEGRGVRTIQGSSG